jgi:hypothetical protein
MSQLKAKQLKLPEAGALLIGGVGGTGTTISASGKDDQILRVVSGSPVWSVNDHLNSINTFNKVTATDETGVKIAVENVDGTEAVDFATFKSGVTTDENFEFSGDTGRLTIAAKGTEANIDIVIAPQGTGEVIIGNSGGGIIQADDDEDLALFGGAGSGNLFLNGGGTGKIYYASDATDPDLEIATVGAVSTAVEAAKVTQTRSEFDGSQTFTLDNKTIPASIIVHLNGLAVKSDLYAYNGTTKVVTFNTVLLGYTLDASDQIVFTYEVTA